MIVNKQYSRARARTYLDITINRVLCAFAAILNCEKSFEVAAVCTECLRAPLYTQYTAKGKRGSEHRAHTINFIFQFDGMK